MEQNQNPYGELETMIRKNLELAEETNRMVRKMRTAGRIATLLRFLWWSLIIAATVWSYMTYFLPYQQQIIDFYQQVESQAGSLSQLLSQGKEFLNSASSLPTSIQITK